jgi:ACT domain-containing protein
MPLTDTTHAEIKALLEKHGAMGVNQLAKELDIPLSTMQKYLDKDQTYFKKNQARKWVLPETSVNTDLNVVSSNYANVIDSQLMSMNALIETLMSQFRATITLIETNKPRNAPVAGIAPNIDPQVLKLDKTIKDNYALFKKYVKVVPEEYQDLIKNLDLARLTAERGTLHVKGEFGKEIAALMLEKITELSHDTLVVLEEYQKEA